MPSCMQLTTAAHYHDKGPCKISAYLVKDFSEKGEKSAKDACTDTQLCMQITTSSIFSCRSL